MASILSSIVRRLRLPTPATSRPKLLSFVFLLGKDMVTERESVRERDENERRERDDQVTKVSTVRLRERKYGSGGVGTVGYMLDFFFFFFKSINEWLGRSGGYPKKYAKSVICPLSKDLKYLYPYPPVYMLTDGQTVQPDWSGRSGFAVFCPPLLSIYI